MRAAEVVPVEGSGRVLVRDVDIEVAVLVPVEERDAPPVAPVGETDPRGDLLEGAIAAVSVEAVGLASREALHSDAGPLGGVRRVEAGLHGDGRQVAPVALGARGDEAVHGEDVEPAVRVVVEEPAAPPPPAIAGAGGRGHVRERPVSPVEEEHVALLQVLLGRDVGHVGVGETVAVEVPEVDIHALERLASDRALGHVREGAVPVREEDLVLPEVVRDVEVGVAVVVDVGDARIERPARVVQLEARRHVLEPEVAQVPVEDVGASVPRRLEAVVEDPRRLELREIDGREVIADEEVEEAVAIVVEGEDAVPVPGVTRPGGIRDFREPPAVVPEEAVSPPLDHVELRVPVVVEVREGRIHADAAVIVDVGHAGLAGDVLEARAVVPEERVGEALSGRRQVEVVVAVPVEVAGRRRGADGGDPRHDVLELRIELALPVDVRDPGLRRDVDEPRDRTAPREVVPAKRELLDPGRQRRGGARGRGGSRDLPGRRGRGGDGGGGRGRSSRGVAPRAGSEERGDEHQACGAKAAASNRGHPSLPTVRVWYSSSHRRRAGSHPSGGIPGG